MGIGKEVLEKEGGQQVEHLRHLMRPQSQPVRGLLKERRGLGQTKLGNRRMQSPGDMDAAARGYSYS